MNNASSTTIPATPPTTGLATRFTAFRILLMLSLVLPTAVWTSYQTFVILEPNELRPLEWVQLCLASVLYLWLSMAFWTAIIGFILKLFKRDPLTLKRQHAFADKHLKLNNRHALIMPVYNEDTLRIMAGFEANVLGISKEAQSDQFDFYMLSDTQDESLIDKELSYWASMLKRLPSDIANRCFYRRRVNNTERKVGNVKDFCQRWGYMYESMTVLDADSVMSGSKVVELAQRMEFNAKVGLIQTIPMPVRQTTFFGRFVQFAAHVYSPMLATGLAFWQTNSANYWGHNATIRISAFIDTCGLPKLTGRKPFGGDILSHDFVEAALLRRAGWEVYLLTDHHGSYEEVPPNIIDYATRDRRWVQGNMQHLALIKTPKLRTANRLHFLFGAFAYVSSILLLFMLIAGTADAVIKSLTPPVYFTQPYQLFPTWLITKQAVMEITLYVTIALLFLPKMLGILLTLLQRSREFGGPLKFMFSAILEFSFAVLLAPIMLMYHSYFVLNVLAGKSVKWEAQTREGKMLPWRTAFTFTWPLTLLGLVWSAVVLVFAPALFYWLLPVLTGLVLAYPVIRYSSSVSLGLMFKRIGILLIPEELRPTYEMKKLQQTTANLNAAPYLVNVFTLPAEQWQDMQSQHLPNAIPDDKNKETQEGTNILTPKKLA
ncbi:glucans biosynthesis glucosyltransferase MdoH [Agaribacter marinus]|uniref:Glucans biosynthesis glucosyltransferase H n=1 Tax=Agaribacter marinus TaxID=1431249 RepID=A0AA37SZU8_9ALTE|nr:glucans biosynthesis glucosyltransferase MdoH [Agaribacter marinus]GLR71624.1 hypothetical protein GCM10007852_25320 [Agaribacter marinus]